MNTIPPIFIAVLWTLTTLFPIAACASSEPSLADDPADDAAFCGSMTEAECLESADCTLVLAEEEEGGYLCREATVPCETGFKQGSDGAESCTAKAGCTFVPGNCFCPPGVTCVCGGGPPPTCVTEEQREEAQEPDSGPVG